MDMLCATRWRCEAWRRFGEQLRNQTPGCRAQPLWCGAPCRSSLQDMLVNALEARGCRGDHLLWRHLVEHLSWNGAALPTSGDTLTVGGALVQTWSCSGTGHHA